MVSETKLHEWSGAILKVLQQGTDDKAVQDFAEYVDKKAHGLE